jgi:signal transduction histidine kinase
MLLSRREAVVLPLAVGLLLALLAGLAFLQYRWVGQIGEADRARLRSTARMRAEQLARDFDRELTRAFFWLQVSRDDDADTDGSAYAERHAQWARIAPHPDLVSAVLLVERGEDEEWRLSRWVPAQQRFASEPWSEELAPLRERLALLAAEGPEGPPRPGPPGFGDLLLDRPLALLCPVPRIHRHTEGRRLWSIAALTVLVLDRRVIGERILPELVARHFEGADALGFDVAVVRQQPPRETIYSSNPARALDETGDAIVGLFSLRFEDVREAGMMPRMPEPPADGDNGRRDLRRFPFARRMAFGRSQPAEVGQWRLIASYKAGSVDQVVAAAHRRNLATSFGVLLLLAASAGLIVASAQRARRLAERQIDFVAGVSHELRTPVAVICAAGENLADGVIADAERVRRYGGVVRDEGRRLAAMVERVLEFAGSEPRRRKYRFESLALAGLVQEALAAHKRPLQQGGFEVQVTVPPDLPTIRGDRGALRRVLENLIENAIKYSGEGRLIAVSARKAERGDRPAVAISIRDEGIGIPKRELASIFQPFHRGREAVARQIHGTGLGLSLVRRIVESHGGQIDAMNAPGRGSIFTVTLPVEVERRQEAQEETAGDGPNEA